MDTGESAAVAADAEMTPEVVPAAKLDRSAQRKKKKAKAVIPSYGEGGLGWGVAPRGGPLAVTVGLVCPSTHIDRVQAYIQKVFDLDVLSVSGGLELKAHVLSYHSTLGSRVIEKKNIRLRSGFRV